MPNKVIVVGAGIAGLAAAQVLHRHGLDVQVLERDSRVGGRIKSRPFHGRIIECGAQFPSTGYHHIPRMLVDAGLRTVTCSPWASFACDGTWHRVHQNRPITLWSSGLLRAGEFARLGWGVMKALRESPRPASASYGCYAPLDDEDALAWSDRALGPAAARLFEPSVHGFYFHSLEGSSRGLVHALLDFRGAQALAVPAGWETLPRFMAERLEVHTGSHVSAVQQIRGCVQVEADGECLHADAVILATPAPISLGLLRGPTIQEQALLSTRYAASLHVALGFAPEWQWPSDLTGIHGLLIGSPSLVASMVVEQSRVACSAPQVLTLMLGNAAALRLGSRDDATVLQEVLLWLAARWPGLSDGVVAHRVQRWPLAEPLSPPGRARAIQLYRNSLAPERRIVLCGDSTGLPWTDGAAETGIWAAARILERLS